MYYDILSTVFLSIIVLMFFKMEDRFYPPRYDRIISVAACILVATLHVYMSMTITRSVFKSFVFMFNLFILTVGFHRISSFERGFQLTFFIILWFACLDFITSIIYGVVNHGIYNMYIVHEMMTTLFAYGMILVFITYKPAYRIIASQTGRTRLGIHRLLIIVLVISASLLIVALFAYLHSNMDNSAYLSNGYLTGAAVAASIVLYWLFGRLDREYEDLEALQLARQQERMRQERLEKLETDYRASRESAHDMKNHLIAIESLYDSGQRVEAERYLDRLLDQVDDKQIVDKTKRGSAE